MQENFTEYYGNFNPRSREGSDSARVYIHHFKAYFNPRSREGSDVDGL